ncbi:MAG: formylglycine-generating enzyme family protein, partial [Polyangiaceae bacterium]|nr:formylglycine-generating enzyme family protein [Polyangiaceae bacterium]
RESIRRLGAAVPAHVRKVRLRGLLALRPSLDSLATAGKHALRILLAVAVAIAIVALVVASVRTLRHSSEDDVAIHNATCGAGFSRVGTRCLVLATAACPPPLVVTPRGCDEPLSSTVLVARTTVMIGPSDWEAEGTVKPRVIETEPFHIDRLEVSVGRAFCPSCPLPNPDVFDHVDSARAASNVTRDEARSFCIAKGGRLPTEDEWIAAAAGDRPRRYPWGDTGAVCRRGAWGLVSGPCGVGAVAPDTVGAHPDGATPSGIHDLAGNVAEWVEAPCAHCAVTRGGSFESALATDLRTWRRSEVPEDSRSPAIGFRCAYNANEAGSKLP